MTIVHLHLEATEDHPARESSGLQRSTDGGWKKLVSEKKDIVSKELSICREFASPLEQVFAELQ
jgi:hypothetical protein